MTIITISQGKLKGGRSTNENGFKYLEFLGIPYAKPPLGDLRFKSPQNPEPWCEVRDATVSLQTNNIASQVHIVNGQTTGSEDCLYLNVFTPRLASNDSNALPVMVYIHGGGFILGNGIIKAENGPDFLVENNAVIVTINYRLGVLGFLSLDIPEAAGNMGLKDQVKALQWIQNNISHFGGDKHNVTIFGISAGAASIEYLILSPLAKGLFHRAILQSGSCLNDWAINYEPKKIVLQLVEELGYEGSTEDNQAIHEYLLTIPAVDLTIAASKSAVNFTTKRTFFGFVPTIEKDFGSGDAVLVEHPYKLLKQGKFNRVPVLKGFSANEGALLSILKPLAVNGLTATKNFAEYWSYDFETDDNSKYIAKITSAYLKNLNPEDEWAAGFFGDLNFCSGIWTAGKILSSKGIPVYMYKFSYDGNINALKVIYGLKKKGAMHGDDLSYILRMNSVISTKNPNETDKLVRNTMTKLWTNFAWGRYPLSDNCAGVPEWPEFTEQAPVYLNIDKQFTIEANYEPQKMAVFEEIYEKYEK